MIVVTFKVPDRTSRLDKVDDKIQWLRDNKIEAIFTGITNHDGVWFEYWLLWDSVSAITFKMSF